MPTDNNFLIDFDNSQLNNFDTIDLLYQQNMIPYKGGESSDTLRLLREESDFFTMLDAFLQLRKNRIMNNFKNKYKNNPALYIDRKFFPIVSFSKKETNENAGNMHYLYGENYFKNNKFHILEDKYNDYIQNRYNISVNTAGEALDSSKEWKSPLNSQYITPKTFSHMERFMNSLSKISNGNINLFEAKTIETYFIVRNNMKLYKEQLFSKNIFPSEIENDLKKYNKNLFDELKKTDYYKSLSEKDKRKEYNKMGRYDYGVKHFGMKIQNKKDFIISWNKLKIYDLSKKGKIEMELKSDYYLVPILPIKEGGKPDIIYDLYVIRKNNLDVELREEKIDTLRISLKKYNAIGLESSKKIKLKNNGNIEDKNIIKQLRKFIKDDTLESFLRKNIESETERQASRKNDKVSVAINKVKLYKRKFIDIVNGFIESMNKNADLLKQNYKKATDEIENAKKLYIAQMKILKNHFKDNTKLYGLIGKDLQEFVNFIKTNPGDSTIPKIKRIKLDISAVNKETPKKTILAFIKDIEKTNRIITRLRNKEIKSNEYNLRRDIEKIAEIIEYNITYDEYNTNKNKRDYFHKKLKLIDTKMTEIDKNIEKLEQRLLAGDTELLSYILKKFILTEGKVKYDTLLELDDILNGKVKIKDYLTSDVLGKLKVEIGFGARSNMYCIPVDEKLIPNKNDYYDFLKRFISYGDEDRAEEFGRADLILVSDKVNLNETPEELFIKLAKSIETTKDYLEDWIDKYNQGTKQIYIRFVKFN